MPVFQAYLEAHPTDADFVYDFTEFSRTETTESVPVLFKRLVDKCELCSACHRPRYRELLCAAHHFDQVISPEMERLNRLHHALSNPPDDLDALLKSYNDLVDDFTSDEKVVEHIQRVEDVLKAYETHLKQAEEEEEEDSDDKPVPAPFTRVKQPESLEEDDDEEEEEEEESSSSSSVDEESSSSSASQSEADEKESKKRTRTGELVLVNETLDYVLSQYDEQLPEGAKTCLKLLRDGDGSARALAELLNNDEQVRYEYIVVSTIIATGVVVFNASFATFEEANAYVQQFHMTEYINRSIVKKRINV